jgi:hypothetical protein
MNSDTSFKQLSNNLNALNGSSGEAVELTHHKRVPFLKDFQEVQELRSIHCLSGEGLGASRFRGTGSRCFWN